MSWFLRCFFNLLIDKKYSPLKSFYKSEKGIIISLVPVYAYAPVYMWDVFWRRLGLMVNGDGVEKIFPLPSQNFYLCSGYHHISHKMKTIHIFTRM